VAELLLDISIGLTICYAFVNGFHDGPNVVATLVCSKSMHPVRALAVAATSEFLGALILGTAVAQTMAGSIFNTELIGILTAQQVYSIAIGAVTAAMVWNLVTWLLGLPSSSSHALVGGLVGVGWMAMGLNGIAVETVIESVFLPLFCGPIAGILGGFFVFHIIRQLFSGAHRSVGHLFAFLQKPSMIFLSASHGSNDAQKSMGIIAFVLLAGGSLKADAIPIPHWVMVACAAALAIGLTTGGWRIVKTVGYGICRLEPVHSFASQVTAASVILGASLLGWPVSTAQVVASSVMGVGASRRLSGVRWHAAANIAYAWFLTVPVAGCMGASVYWLLARIIQK
jgi:inorganic phosphate transporter, PiT family